MTRIKQSDIKAMAQSLGFELEYYRYGTYKIIKPGQDYFETDGIYRSDSLREIKSWLHGVSYERHK